MKHLAALFIACLPINVSYGTYDIYASWSEITPLIREYLLAVADNVPEQAIKEAEQKLLAHHTTSRSLSLQPYYSSKISQELQDTFTLQSMHVISAINAAKKPDSQKFSEELEALRCDAIALSSQLNKINPYIDFCKLQELLFSYLDQFKTMVLERVSGKWSLDAQNYERLRSKQRDIAQYVARAIGHAFPPKDFISIQKS